MPRQKNPHGQYFTPRALAEMMVSLATSRPDARVLEPSAGQGVFLDVLSAHGFTDVTGIEIDPALVRSSAHPLLLGSFVSWTPPHPYDLVIGNPPYIRWRDLSAEGRAEVEAHRLFGTLFNSLSDYLTVFIALSVEALAPRGELVFVTPSFWMHTAHSAALRNWLLERGHVSDVVHFGEAAVFPGVASSIIVFRFVKDGGPAPASDVTLHRYVGPRRVPSELSLDDAALFTHTAVAPFSAGAHWTLADRESLAPVEAVEQACRRPDGEVARLGDYVDIANGMVSGRDAAFTVTADLYAALSPRERRALIPVAKARQLSPYVARESALYIHLPTGLSEAEARRRYPRILAHLDTRRADLERRYSYGRALAYWEWSFERSRTFFLNGQPKGMVPSKERLTARRCVRVALAPSGVVATQDVTAFAPRSGVKESLEYIVAYLNQPPVTDWIRVRGLMKGGVAEFSERPLGDVPMRAIDWSDPDEVAAHERITEDMVALGGAPEAQRAALEARIASAFTDLLALGR